ncbi:phosphatase type 1 complex subunit Hex2 Reg1 protein [Rutstroemia sp. NJR-2017a BBW]|nr:phosphatase type 1 complex subunit Hex2 Reg1 protein [Rutstroemia sp. NJR-2017a BBW]
MDLSREDEYFEWVDTPDVVDAAPRIIHQPQISSLNAICMESEGEDEIEFPSYDDPRSPTQEAELDDKRIYDEQVEYYMQSPTLQPEYLEDDESLCSSPSLITSPMDSLDSLDSLDYLEPCDITETVDDTAVQVQPSHHVDYLAHDWPEEDLWASWKYVQSNRSAYENSRRLENASWRCWAKKRSNLKTIAPETVDWMKDCDTTWLYGPLHKAGSKFECASSSAESSSRGTQISRSASCTDVKPILKRRMVSDILLKRSSSTMNAPRRLSSPSPSSSGRSSPSSSSSRKCVRFHDQVDQFISVNTIPEECVPTFSKGESAILEDIPEASEPKNTPWTSTPPIVAKICSTSLKPVREITDLTDAVANLKYSLTSYDYFAQPGFDYTEYSNANSGDDDDEWESSMIGMDVRPSTKSIPMSIY